MKAHGILILALLSGGCLQLSHPDPFSTGEAKIRLIPPVTEVHAGEQVHVAIEITNTGTRKLRLPDPSFFTIVDDSLGHGTWYACRLVLLR